MISPFTGEPEPETGTIANCTKKPFPRGTVQTEIWNRLNRSTPKPQPNRGRPEVCAIQFWKFTHSNTIQGDVDSVSDTLNPLALIHQLLIWQDGADQKDLRMACVHLSSVAFISFGSKADHFAQTFTRQASMCINFGTSIRTRAENK